MEWPADAVGDVMRRMEADGFDFTQEHHINFLVDFGRWPPPMDAIIRLKGRFDLVSRVPPEEDGNGNVLCTIEARITHELVTSTQREITALVEEFGGHCSEWMVPA